MKKIIATLLVMAMVMTMFVMPAGAAFNEPEVIGTLENPTATSTPTPTATVAPTATPTPAEGMVKVTLKGKITESTYDLGAFGERTFTVPVGTTITLEPAASWGAPPKIAYYVNEYGKILSTEQTFSITIYRDMFIEGIVAVDTDEVINTGAYYVPYAFTDKDGKQLIHTGVWTGEEEIPVNVTAPHVPGYTFEGWDFDGDGIADVDVDAYYLPGCLTDYLTVIWESWVVETIPDPYAAPYLIKPVYVEDSQSFESDVFIFVDDNLGDIYTVKVNGTKINPHKLPGQIIVSVCCGDMVTVEVDPTKLPAGASVAWTTDMGANLGYFNQFSVVATTATHFFRCNINTTIVEEEVVMDVFYQNFADRNFSARFAVTNGTIVTAGFKCVNNEFGSNSYAEEYYLVDDVAGKGYNAYQYDLALLADHWDIAPYLVYVDANGVQHEVLGDFITVGGSGANAGIAW